MPCGDNVSAQARGKLYKLLRLQRAGVRNNPWCGKSLQLRLQNQSQGFARHPVLVLSTTKIPKIKVIPHAKRQSIRFRQASAHLAYTSRAVARWFHVNRSGCAFKPQSFGDLVSDGEPEPNSPPHELKTARCDQPRE